MKMLVHQTTAVVREPPGNKSSIRKKSGKECELLYKQEAELPWCSFKKEVNRAVVGFKGFEEGCPLMWVRVWDVLFEG